jgi:hypothetical protein
MNIRRAEEIAQKYLSQPQQLRGRNSGATSKQHTQTTTSLHNTKGSFERSSKNRMTNSDLSEKIRSLKNYLTNDINHWMKTSTLERIS